MNNTVHSALESHIDLSGKYIKTYASRENLLKAIEKLNPTTTSDRTQLRYLVVRTPAGKWTAIFYGDCQGLLNTGFPLIWQS